MENPHSSSDRLQELVCCRSSSTLVNPESIKKNERSEKLKELTELLKRNMSSSAPSPRKSKSQLYAASKTLDKNKQIENTTSNSEEVAPIYPKEENSVMLFVDMSSFNEVNCFKNKAKVTNRRSKESFTNSPSIEFFSINKESTKASIPKIDSDLYANLPRHKSKMMIGSCTRKGISTRSASFSDIDFPSKSYFRNDSNAASHRLNDKAIENCLVPVPVYECSEQGSESRTPYFGLVEVLQFESDSHYKLRDSEVEKQIIDKLNRKLLIPPVTICKDFLVQCDEIGRKDLDQYQKSKPMSFISSNARHLDLMEVKKRYSSDDIEIGRIKRYSLNCPTHRFCSRAVEKQKTDKSKRRKGMYFESSDWEKKCQAHQSRKCEREILTANVHKNNRFQFNKCSSILCLNCLESKNYLNRNSPDLKYRNQFKQTEQISNKVSIHSFKEDTSKQTDLKNPFQKIQDCTRYSQRLLRSPHVHMIDVDMRKPNRSHFEELTSPDTFIVRRAASANQNCRSFEYHVPATIHYTNSFRARKLYSFLPNPTYTRASSAPSQIEKIGGTSDLANPKCFDKRYQSTIDDLIYFGVRNGLETKAKPIRKINKYNSSEKQTKRSTGDIIISHVSQKSSEGNSIANRKTETDFDDNLLPGLLTQFLHEKNENFNFKQSCKTLTRGMDICFWETLLSPDSANDSDLAKWKLKNGKALATILLSVKSTQALHIKNCTTSISAY